VTGGDPSDIDGTIRSTIEGADFYFLNPAGVVFGRNASLDVKGSFHVSTADELRFADGAVFSAANPAASSFTVAPPEAFGFLGSTDGRILVDQSVLEVPAGKAFSIVGGNIDIAGGPEGFIAAEAGQITLAAVDGPGEARLESGDVDAASAANIRLVDRALVDATGNGGGTIRIRGGRVLAEGGSQLFADNSGTRNGSGGGVDVAARVLRLRDGSSLTADVVEEGSGTGGHVRVRTNVLEMSGGSSLAADTFAEGNAGNVSVVTGELTIDGAGAEGFTGISSDANSGASGDAGMVEVAADDLRIFNEGTVSSSTFAEGDAGGVVVEAGELT
jgi:large exoprotein involved in heme utilization and adhesion